MFIFNFAYDCQILHMQKCIMKSQNYQEIEICEEQKMAIQNLFMYGQVYLCDY